MEIFLTVFAGVTVFVLGQIIIKFVIEPIHEFYRFTGEIADSLIFYANVYSNPGLAKEELLRDASLIFRQQASKLFRRVHAIPLYGCWAWGRLIPKRKDVMKAGGYLIGLSNGVYDKSASATEHNEKRRRAIEQWLRLGTEE